MNSRYVIAPAGPADAAELAQVHVRSWRETYPELLPAGFLERMSSDAHARRWAWRLARGGEITLAAEGPEGLAGYVSAERARRPANAVAEGEITTLYVLQRAQGLGLGRALFEAAARALAAQGATSLIVWVLSENRAARAFYQRLGGVEAGEGIEQVGGLQIASVAYRWSDLGTWLAGRAG